MLTVSHISVLSMVSALSSDRRIFSNDHDSIALARVPQPLALPSSRVAELVTDKLCGKTASKNSSRVILFDRFMVRGTGFVFWAAL